MVTNKMKLGDIEMVVLIKQCSSVVRSKMPKNFKDPGILTLLIQISKNDVVYTLSDLGTSINLKPLSDTRLKKTRALFSYTLNGRQNQRVSQRDHRGCSHHGW